MTEAVDDKVGVDTGELVAAADAMTREGRALADGAGGVDRRVPALPDDDHGLVAAIVEFDAAREQFDRRAGRAIEALGQTLSIQAVESMTADRFVHLPEAAR